MATRRIPRFLSRFCDPSSSLVSDSSRENLLGEIAVMISGFCFLFLCFTSTGRGNSDACLIEFVDLVELNHFFDQQGRHVYDQVIFYERHPGNGKYHVRAWCLVEDRESLNRRPVKDVHNDLYRVDWLDTDLRVLRSIRSKLYRESWSHVDPERTDKKQLDERLRLSLVQPSKRRQSAEERITKESLPRGTIEIPPQVTVNIDPSQSIASQKSP